MTFKEQIVEISEILDSNCEGIPDTVCQEYDCSTCKATQIIGRGYRKQAEGRWKGAGLGDYYCSICQTTFSGGDEYNFCPHCGAKMKGD